MGAAATRIQFAMYIHAGASVVSQQLQRYSEILQQIRRTEVT